MSGLRGVDQTGGYEVIPARVGRVVVTRSQAVGGEDRLPDC